MSATTDLIFSADRLIDHTDLLNLECSCLRPVPVCTQSLVLLTLEEDTPFDKNICIPSLLALMGSLYYLEITIGYILKVNSSSVSLYLALRFPESSASIIDIVFECLKKQFPTLKKNFITMLPLFDPLPQAISSATFVPSPKHHMPSILPQFFKAMEGQSYTLLFLLSPTDQCTYLKYKKQLLALHAQLFPLREKTHSHTDTTSDTKNKSCSTSDSKTHTATTAHNENSSDTLSNSEVSSGNLNFSPKLTDKATLSQSGSSSCTTNRSNNTSNAESHTCAQQTVCSCSNSDSDSCTTTNTHTYSTRSFNKEIDLHLSKLESLLAIFETNLTLPIFAFSSYFIASSIGTALLANTTFTTLLQPTAPLSKSFYVNDWYNNPNCLKTLSCYLETLQHPIFCPPTSPQPVTPTLICNQYQAYQLLFSCTAPNT